MHDVLHVHPALYAYFMPKGLFLKLSVNGILSSYLGTFSVYWVPIGCPTDPLLHLALRAFSGTRRDIISKIVNLEIISVVLATVPY